MREVTESFMAAPTYTMLPATRERDIERKREITCLHVRVGTQYPV